MGTQNEPLDGEIPDFFFNCMGSTAEAAKYVKGIAVHWYGNAYTPASLLTKTHEMFPDRFILATEACSGSMPWETEKVILGSWERLEDYAKDISEDLNNWST